MKQKILALLMLSLLFVGDSVGRAMGVYQFTNTDTFTKLYLYASSGNPTGKLGHSHGFAPMHPIVVGQSGNLLDFQGCYGSMIMDIIDENNSTVFSSIIESGCHYFNIPDFVKGCFTLKVEYNDHTYTTYIEL